MDARIVPNQVINSLQISVLKEVPSGNFNPGVNFLLKNISDDDVEVTIIPAGQKVELYLLKIMPMVIALAYLVNTVSSYFGVDIPILASIAGMSLIPLI